MTGKDAIIAFIHKNGYKRINADGEFEQYVNKISPELISAIALSYSKVVISMMFVVGNKIYKGHREYPLDYIRDREDGLLAIHSMFHDVYSTIMDSILKTSIKLLKTI